MRRLSPLVLGVFCLVSSLVFAQEPPPGAIVVDGDEVEYFPDERKVVGKGNIAIDYQGSVVTADSVTVYLDTKEAFAQGEVVLKRGEDTFHGRELRYNFDTKKGVLKDARGVSLPWYFGGKEVERKDEKTFLVKEGYITTCDLPEPHYKIRTKEIELHADDKVVAKNVTVQTRGIPVLYAPYFSRSIKEKDVQPLGVSVVPGYSSRWGAYALSTWSLPMTENVSADLHLDGRSKRGIGIGPDLTYETELGEGELKAYYLNDEERQSPVDLRKDRDRYRAWWQHRWDISPETYFLGEYKKWSDPFMTRDYFNREYAADFQPTTQASFIHNAGHVTGALITRKRANHFFTETERLPELRLTSQRLSLWESGFFFQGEANAGNLTRASASSDNTTTERVDLFSELAYEKNISGIQAVPRVSARQTYYGKELNGKKDVVRGLFTAGFDLSTRLRRFYPVETAFWGLELSGLRHILEPGLTYQYTPGPTLASGRLPAFDEIDALTEKNRLTFSLDNKFQTRRTFDGKKEIVDFVDFVLKSNYDFKSGWEGKLVDVTGDLELRPSPFWGLILETTYDIERRDVTTSNLDLFALARENWRLDFLHRYEKGISNQLTTKLSWQFHPKWKVELYDRFEANNREFEEEEIVLTRDLHCFEGALGVNVRDTEDREQPGSEFSVYVMFRLKAFPEAPVELGNRASISRRLIGSRRSGQMD